MNNRIDIIVDISGSISENGKAAVVKYLLYSIKNIFMREEYSKYKVNLLQWSDKMMDVNSIAELRFNGTLNDEVMKKYLDGLEEKDAIILLTDGSFPTKIRNVFRNISEKKIKLYCVAIGAEADIFGLKKISTYPVIFNSADIANLISKVCGYYDV